jgi:hypothetical protein
MALAAVFAGFAIGGTAALWVVPSVAVAATDGQCNTYLVTDAERSAGGYNTYADLGIRASGEDYVYGGGDQCAHTDSVTVYATNGDFVEAGWSTQRAAYDSSQGSTCDLSGQTNSPHALYVYRLHGNVTCTWKLNVSVVNEDQPTVSVRSDLSAGGDPHDWILDFSNGTGNGFTVKVTGMSFTKGAGLTNCDRHFEGNSDTNPSDPAKESCDAHFTGMQFRTSNDRWASWATPICSGNANGDDVYNNQVTAPAEVKVSANPAKCS